MEPRTNISRNNWEGFGYLFTVTIDILKRNPQLTPERVQDHFDYIIGMALADLLSSDCVAAIGINKNMLDLKYKLIPKYYDLLQMVLSEGEDSPVENQRIPLKQAEENPKQTEHDQMVEAGKKLIDRLLLEIASFREKNELSDKEVYSALNAMSRFFATKKTAKNKGEK